MSKKRAQIIYSGKVHGVGFRWTAERIANSLNLTGWVMNCLDGDVEALCEGSEKDINTFIDKVANSMSGYIRSTRVKWGDATDEFNSFNIRSY